MTRALAIAALLGAGALLMAARPGTEQQLVQQLNGQPTRWVMPDGGPSGAFGAGPLGCVPLTGGHTTEGATIAPNTLLFVPLVPINVCSRPSAYSTSWDGGCTYIPNDINYGVPLPVGVPQYLTPDAKATQLCFITDAGSLVVPVWFTQ